MLKRAPNRPCYCGSERKTKRCCGPILRGQPAQSPEALMRSRYTAYATGNVRHIMATTDPQGPHFAQNQTEWENEIRRFCTGTNFENLTVHDTDQDENTGWVLFTAHLRKGELDRSFSERSRFTRVGGRWLYHSGTPGPRLR